MKQNQKGFTLIELMVIIAIIGLLSSVITVALSRARIKGRDSKRLADTRQIITALQAYNSSYGDWPGTYNQWYCLAPNTEANCYSNLYGPITSTMETQFSEFITTFPKYGVPAGNTYYDRYIYKYGAVSGKTGGWISAIYEETPPSGICTTTPTLYDGYYFCNIYLGP
ncbi:MAG: type II secretion system protein [Candidatus Doudnabacteria bacterium]